MGRIVICKVLSYSGKYFLLAESLGIPTHWKDLQGNLNVVPLAATDKEYIDTEKDFIASIGAGVTVVKVNDLSI